MTFKFALAAFKPLKPVLKKPIVFPLAGL